jgi:hypothetical protein
MKQTLFLIVFMFSINASAYAQIPQDGLIAFYPFNGNANDMSGNSNNGNINGASFTTDRFDNGNSALSFNGKSDYVLLPNIIPVTKGSISYWFMTDTVSSTIPQILIYSSSTIDNGFGSIHDALEFDTGVGAHGGFYGFKNGDINVPQISYYDTLQIQAHHWYNIVVTYDIQDSIKYYINGKEINSQILDGIPFSNHTPTYTYIGRPSMDTRYFDGKFDSFRIYDRILSNNEIESLNNEGICLETRYDTIAVYDTIYRYNNAFRYLKYDSYYSEDDGQVDVYEIEAYSHGTNIALDKSGYANSYETGDYSTNGIKAVDGNANSRWSSDRNTQGPDSINPHFIVIDLNQDDTIDSLKLNIKGLDSWNQTFDLSVSSDSVNWYSVGKGYDTTGVFTFIPKVPFIVRDTVHTMVYDSTFVTVYDTTSISVIDSVLISVTDTLIINAVLTSVNSSNNINTIKIYPNPAKDHITIDYGNYSSMNGYTLKIVNSLGQQVYSTSIDQFESYLNLSDWGGKGIYFVYLIDNLNNITEVKKIVLL